MLQGFKPPLAHFFDHGRSAYSVRSLCFAFECKLLRVEGFSFLWPLLQQNLTNAHTAKIQKRNNATTSTENKVKTKKNTKKTKTKQNTKSEEQAGTRNTKTQEEIL